MSKERYVEHTVAWELPNRDGVTKGNYNLADIETKYLPIQTEVVIDSKDHTIDELKQRISELEEQLKHAQKQLAIEELEFVLKNFRNRPAYFDVAKQELCLSDQDKQFIDFINSRIKELGGGGEN